MADALEVYTVGQGELLHNAFTGISLLAGSPFMSQLVLIGGLVGAIIGVYRLAVTGSGKTLLTWFVLYVFVFGVVLSPKESISINDASDPSLVSEVIDDVPFGLAMAAHLATALGDEVGDTLDTAFSAVDGFQYRDNKAFWGPRLMRELSIARINDSNVTRNMDSFLRDCAIPRFQGNPALYTRFKNDNDAWSFLGASGNATPAEFAYEVLSTTYQAPGSADVSLIGCNEAHENITNELDRVGDNTASRLAADFYPNENDELVRRADMFADIQEFGNDLIGLSFQGPEILRQAMVLNQFESSLSSVATNGADASMMAFLNARGETGFRVGSIALGNLVQTGIPLLYTLILVLLVAIFPIIILLGLIPGIGGKVVTNYLVSFIHMQAFIILFVIINTMINFELARRASSRFAATAESTAGITFERMGILSTLPTDVVATATIMLSLIPLYIGIFKGGVEALGTAFERTLQPYQEAAKTATQEFSAGNFRFADTSYRNSHQNKINTAAALSTFGSTVTSAGGSTITAAESGRVFAQSPKSDFADSVGVSSGIGASTSATLTKATAAEKQARESQSAARTSAAANTAAFLLSDAATNSQEAAAIFGDNQSYSNAVSALNSALDKYSASEGSRSDTARNLSYALTAGADAGIGGGGGRGGFGNGGSGGNSGGGARTGFSGGARVGINGAIGGSSTKGEGSSFGIASEFLETLQADERFSSAVDAATRNSSREGFNASQTLTEGQANSYTELASANAEYAEKKEQSLNAASAYSEHYDQSGSYNQQLGNEVADQIYQREGIAGLTAAADAGGTLGGASHVQPYADAAIESSTGLSQGSINQTADNNHGRAYAFNGVSVGGVQASTGQVNSDPLGSLGAPELSVPELSGAGQEAQQDFNVSRDDFKGGEFNVATERGRGVSSTFGDNGSLDVNDRSNSNSITPEGIEGVVNNEENMRAKFALNYDLGSGQAEYPMLDSSDVKYQYGKFEDGGPTAPEGYTEVSQDMVDGRLATKEGRGGIFSEPTIKAYAPEEKVNELNEARQEWDNQNAEAEEFRQNANGFTPKSQLNE